MSNKLGRKIILLLVFLVATETDAYLTTSCGITVRVPPQYKVTISSPIDFCIFRITELRGEDELLGFYVGNHPSAKPETWQDRQVQDNLQTGYLVENDVKFRRWLLTDTGKMFPNKIHAWYTDSPEHRSRMEAILASLCVGECPE